MQLTQRSTGFRDGRLRRQAVRPVRLFAALAALAVVLLQLAAAAPAGAQQAANDAPQVMSAEAFDSLKRRTDFALQGRDTSEERLAELRKQLQQAATNAAARGEALRGDLQAVQKQLDALGPPPGEKDPPESAEIAKERENLKAEISRIDGRIKALELRRTEASTLSDRIGSFQRARLIDWLSTRGPLPLAPATLTAAGAESAAFSEALIAWTGRSTLFSGEGLGARWMWLIAVFLLAWAIGWPLRRTLIARVLPESDASRPAPDFTERVVRAALVGMVRAVPMALAITAVYAALFRIGVLGELETAVVETSYRGLMALVAAASLTRATFSPARPSWRLVPVTDAAATRATLLLIGLAAVFVVKEILLASIRHAEGGRALLTLVSASGIVLTTVLVWMLAARRTWAQSHGAEVGHDPESEAAAHTMTRWAKPLRLLARGVAVLTSAAVLVGYHHFADFVTDRALLTAAIITVLMLSRVLLVELLRDQLTRRKAARAQEDSQKGRVALAWASLAIDVALIAAGVFLLLPLWGADQGSLTGLLATAVTGFQIGEVRISVTEILIGIGGFVLVLALTKQLKTLLSNRILPMTQLDSGVQDSIATGIGYVGFVIAGLTAVSLVGLDLSNLAIVVGALSVGIGFGLQNIVNNFVSGIILLVERPMKVGDWVQASSAEGFVKRISVRATEIETFDRSSVIVPNSELIAAPVTNWYFKNRMGRIKINVGVSYASDVEKVRDILMAAAVAHPQTLSYPSPVVYFMEFGASSLDFTLILYVADIGHKFQVASDIRFDITRRFRDADIEIPFPQQDIHIRDLDRLERLFHPGEARSAGTQERESEQPAEVRKRREVRVERAVDADGDGDADTD
ncbi:mechanosensitive ion channel domain-containing protein [Futiania mangrovi]|uniref:Mechanosensitive ion channel n=1 Tax=Futiania mangrovi TaxID=2959716 RepID=A0A9J6P9P0_9PROT|nr:mechanosensitive ion channel domain-containing protein [Futiania mangrovii]MCP1336684.1 mechanosensitive ion channel [Futiania mangrovii]